MTLNAKYKVTLLCHFTNNTIRTQAKKCKLNITVRQPPSKKTGTSSNSKRYGSKNKIAYDNGQTE